MPLGPQKQLPLSQERPGQQGWSRSQEALLSPQGRSQVWEDEAHRSPGQQSKSSKQVRPCSLQHLPPVPHTRPGQQSLPDEQENSRSPQAGWQEGL